MRVCRQVCAAVIMFLLLAGVSMAGEATKAVVTVNGVDLYDSELNQEIQKLVPMEATFHNTMSDEKVKSIREKAIASLVEQELQYQDAFARGIKLADGELEKELQRISGNYNSPKEFEKAIEQAGFSSKLFARYVDRMMLVPRVKRAMVDDKAIVTDTAVKDQYDNNKSSYMKPEEYRASLILLKVDPSATDEERAKLKERAESIIKRIKRGDDFAAIAEKESDDMSRIKGGDIGYFHAGRTVPEFEEAVKKLKVGEVSGLVDTIYGLNIIKLTDKKESRQLSFDDMKDKIRAQLVEKEKKRLSEEWMTGIRNKAKIVFPKEG